MLTKINPKVDLLVYFLVVVANSVTINAALSEEGENMACYHDA